MIDFKRNLTTKIMSVKLVFNSYQKAVYIYWCKDWQMRTDCWKRNWLSCHAPEKFWRRLFKRQIAPVVSGCYKLITCAWAYKNRPITRQQGNRLNWDINKTLFATNKLIMCTSTYNALPRYICAASLGACMVYNYILTIRSVWLNPCMYQGPFP